MKSPSIFNYRLHPSSKEWFVMNNSDYNSFLFKSIATEPAFMTFINLAIQLFSTKRQLLINFSHNWLPNLLSMWTNQFF